MNVISLILGILLFALGILILIFTMERNSKLEKGDYIGQSNFIKIYGGVFILIVLGIVLIYVELKDIF